MSSTTTELHTVPFKDSSCYRDAVEFAYKRDLCNSPSPGYYAYKTEGLYSCVNRCGAVPEYQLAGSLCSCDYKCIIYGDCCYDFKDACPGLLQMISREYGHLKKNTGECMGQYYSTVFFCVNSRQNLDDNIVFESTKTNSPRWVLESLFDVKPFQLIVEDLYQGFTFFSSNFYNQCRQPQSVARVAPKKADFKCKKKFKLDRHTHLIDVLTNCQVDDTRYVQTTYSRRCLRYKTITCNCDEDETVQDFLHNVCLGNSSESRVPFYQGLLLLYPQKTEQCIVSTSSHYNVERVDTQSASKSKQNQKDMVMLLEVIPRLLEANETDGNGGEIVYTNNETVNEGGFFSLSDMGYRITISASSEQRLRCPNLKSSISDCKIETCAPGFLLSSSSDSPQQIGGQLCLDPFQMTVEVLVGNKLELPSRCVCLNAIFAVYLLDLWDIKFSNRSHLLRCKVILSLRDGQNETSIEMFKEPMMLSDPPPTLGVIKPHNDLIWNHLRESVRSLKTSCPSEVSPKGVKFCFFVTSELSEETKTICSLLIVNHKIGSVMESWRQQSSSAHKVRRSLLYTDLQSQFLLMIAAQIVYRFHA